MRLDELEAQICSLKNALLKPRSFIERLLGIRRNSQADEALLASLNSLLEWARESRGDAILDAPEKPATNDEAFDRFYLEFENKYRGSQEAIAEKLRPYLNHLSDAVSSKETAAIIDCGCGRGEWLELLKASGYQNAIGLDTNHSMIAECEQKDLNVERTDAIAYLKTRPAGSLQVITAFHLVEHLPFKSLLEFLQVCFEALAPGGIAIIETPNPRNIIVGATTFHFDPTHDKPLPIELLLSATKFTGFNCKFLLQQNPHEDLLKVAKTLPQDSDLLKAGLEAGLDYGVVLQKPQSA